MMVKILKDDNSGNEMNLESQRKELDLVHTKLEQPQWRQYVG